MVLRYAFSTCTHDLAQMMMKRGALSWCKKVDLSALKVEEACEAVANRIHRFCRKVDDFFALYCGCVVWRYACTRQTGNTGLDGKHCVTVRGGQSGSFTPTEPFRTLSPALSYPNQPTMESFVPSTPQIIAVRAENL